MVHVPSFLVGSSVSAVVYLKIHRDLSDRVENPREWRLAQLAQSEFQKLLGSDSTPTNTVTMNKNTPLKTWNDCVLFVHGKANEVFFNGKKDDK